MATLDLTSYGYGKVSYGECPGSPKESCQNNQWRVRREFIVNWQDRWLFALGMLGTAIFQPIPGGIGLWIKRLIPHAYATLGIQADQTKWLFATHIENIEPMAPASLVAGGNFKLDVDNSLSIANYQKAKVVVIYEAPTFSVLTDVEMIQDSATDLVGNKPDESFLTRFVTKFRQPTAEYLTLPYEAYRFALQGSPPNPQDTIIGEKVRGSNGRIISAKEVVYIWHMVPGVPRDYSQYMGTVNTTEFDGYAPGTLLVTGIEVKPYRWFPYFQNSIYGPGLRLFDITYKMKYFSAIDPGTGLEYDLLNLNPFPKEKRGHNFYLRYDFVNGGPPSYELITHNGHLDGARVYQKSEYKDLFRPVPLPPNF